MATTILYGINAVTSLVERSPRKIDELVISENKNRRIDALLTSAAEAGVRVRSESAQRFADALSAEGIDHEAVHQGVFARCQAKEPLSEDALLSLVRKVDKPFLLVLDGVTDPHNIGACIRSACAAGADAVIVPKDKSAGLSAVSRKVASGAAEITPLVIVTNLARCLQKLQSENVWVMGAAGESSTSLYDLDLRGGLALVMGSEGSGMRRLTRETCDQLFAIPMAPDIESLNVSVASGICLFEARRQRS